MSTLEQVREKTNFYKDMFKYTNFNCDPYDGTFLNNKFLTLEIGVKYPWLEYCEQH